MYADRVNDAPPILINGTLCIDTLTFADGSRHDGLSGGCGMYFALACAAVGQPVRLLAAVGHDYPETFVTQLDAAGVDRRGLLQRSGRTFRWHGHYDHTLDDRDTLGLDYDPAVEALPELPAAWHNTRYAFLGVNAPENQIALRQRLTGAALVLLDTIDLYIHRHRGTLLAAIAAVDGLLINQHEMSDLTALSVTADPGSCAAAAAVVFAGSPELRFVIVKLGPTGSVLCVRDAEAVAVPVCRPDVLVDPTGAGDTFAAGLLTCIAQRGVDRDQADLAGVLREGCGWGAVLASFTCEGVGNAEHVRVTGARFAERLRAYHESWGR